MSDSSKEFFKEIKEEFKEIGSKVNKMFEELVSNEGPDGNIGVRADIYETNDRFVLEFDLPGVNKSDVNLQVKDNILIVSGKRVRYSDLGDLTFHKKERRFGSFERNFTLPAGIDTEDIKAKFENGVLSVTFNKESTISEEEAKDINID